MGIGKTESAREGIRTRLIPVVAAASIFCLIWFGLGSPRVKNGSARSLEGDSSSARELRRSEEVDLPESSRRLAPLREASTVRSEPGDLEVEDRGGRVALWGHAVIVLRGELTL